MSCSVCQKRHSYAIIMISREQTNIPYIFVYACIVYKYTMHRTKEEKKTDFLSLSHRISVQRYGLSRNKTEKAMFSQEKIGFPFRIIFLFVFAIHQIQETIFIFSVHDVFSSKIILSLHKRNVRMYVIINVLHIFCHYFYFLFCCCCCFSQLPRQKRLEKKKKEYKHHSMNLMGRRMPTCLMLLSYYYELTWKKQDKKKFKAK